MKIEHVVSETKRTRRGALALLFGLAMMIWVLLLGLQSANPVHAAGTTFTVNSTGDEADKSPGDGVCQITTANQCTLRAAIQEANASAGADTINFNIPSSTDPNCDAFTHVCTIPPAGSALPAITHPVTIDGYTQPDASPNTLAQGTNAVLKIVLEGTNAGLVANGLELDSGINGADASNSVIRGLVINNFSHGSGILILLGGTGYKIDGNFIGTDPSGTTPAANSSGVIAQVSLRNSTIGGTSPADRNLISGNSGDGIAINGSGNKIEGNLVGTKADGTSSISAVINGGSTGIHVIGPSNTIGDSDPSDGDTNADNTIAFNDNGVLISEDQSVGNRILSNSIFSNGSLGIDLNADGVTPNDPKAKDPDIGPNRLQNYPVITEATTPVLVRGGTSITGTLNSTPSTRHKKRTFIIQFFSSPQADPSGYGEGKTFVGKTPVTTNRQGNASFSFTTAQPVTADGQTVVTATATNKKTHDTSEFSQATLVTVSFPF